MHRAPILFPDAELAKNGIEQILSGSFADNFADGVDGDVQVQCDKLERNVGAQGLESAKGGFASATQSILVTRVDHCL
jgi:hypothetical protein